MGRRGARSLGRCGRLLGALGVGAALLGASGPMSALERGRLLFLGELPLPAHMVGHTVTLPAQAYRCANCHTASAQHKTGAEEDFAPLLGARGLTERAARRGGPPSSYDRARFCVLLREGIDPAFVMIAQAMPRYPVTDSECEALWTFVTLP